MYVVLIKLFRLTPIYINPAGLTPLRCKWR